MKRLLILFTALTLSFNTLEAKEPKAKAEFVTTTFSTDIDCESCERKIINSIPFKKGVSGVKVDLPTKLVSVTYNSAKNNEAELVEAFKKIGIVAKVNVIND